MLTLAKTESEIYMAWKVSRGSAQDELFLHCFLYTKLSASDMSNTNARLIY